MLPSGLFEMAHTYIDLSDESVSVNTPPKHRHPSLLTNMIDISVSDSSGSDMNHLERAMTKVSMAAPVFHRPNKI